MGWSCWVLARALACLCVSCKLDLTLIGSSTGHLRTQQELQTEESVKASALTAVWWLTHFTCSRTHSTLWNIKVNHLNHVGEEKHQSSLQVMLLKLILKISVLVGLLTSAVTNTNNVLSTLIPPLKSNFSIIGPRKSTFSSCMLHLFWFQQGNSEAETCSGWSRVNV